MKIAFLFYEGMTALDAVGPHEILSRLPEAQAHELIRQTGIQTYRKPGDIPETFRVKITSDGAGIKYVHPSNEQTYIRVMPGKPHSRNPAQQKPYVPG